MGQHEAFFQRYPPSWEYFKPENYGEYPLHQRKRLAQYDNATRYNDRVVGTIFRLYQDENALVFYFPDHGMDLYETASDYCGHANPRNPKSFDFSCQIPFFIYATERYRQAFPQQIEQIEHSLNKPFNTKDLIYTLMQITGWELAQDGGKNGHGLLHD